MLLIRDADVSKDLAAIRSLWMEYLTWGSDELESKYGFRLPVLEAVEQGIAHIDKFRAPGGRLLLACSASDVVGIACLQRIGANTAEIKRMYVRPANRGAGLGRALLERLLESAMEAGYGCVQLDSADFLTAAHAMYRSVGFVDTDPYPESEIPEEYRRHWVFMKKVLPAGPAAKFG